MDAELARLAAERDAIDARIRDLRARSIESRAQTSSSGVVLPASSTMTPTEKAQLFRSLFRGREDVFPTKWVNARTGRKGFSPACANEWVRGICDKPRIRCAACPHQAFIPVTDEVIHDHLSGRHTIGVYPLLRDETCWFVAADFDRESWRDDIRAFRETSRSMQIPIAIERSSSGDGAHAWFFFLDPIRAATARTMACHLLTETMMRHRDVGLQSYDRLFPNQDSMPEGGFGNLIALPLQLRARRCGNTVFLDDDLEPIPDQWGYLVSIPRIPGAMADAMAIAAKRSRRVVAVKETSDTPHPRPPQESAEEAPSVISAVLSDRLYVDRGGLPVWAVAEIKRVATFANPEFFARQRMRLSTARTPRVLGCFEETAATLALPRGCLEGLRTVFEECRTRLSSEDRRTEGSALDTGFHGTLGPKQAAVIEELLKHDIGLFVAPAGSGKTVVGAALIARRGRNTLVLVHRKPLLEQWVVRLASFLDLEAGAIGQIGAGKSRSTGRIDVAMIQSIARMKDPAQLLSGYGQIIVDECHHVPAYTFEKVLSSASSRFMTGLTATPCRRDGLHPIMAMQLGPVRASLTKADAPTAIRQRLIVRRTGFDLPPDSPKISIQRLYALLSADRVRNDAILDDIIAALEDGRSPLVLTERRDHLEVLQRSLSRVSPGCVVLHGGMTARARRDALQSAVGRGERVVLATGRYIGEGFDDSRLDSLFLTMPVSWRGTLAQYAGRLHRPSVSKAEVRVHDYVDSAVPTLARMAARRHGTLRALGYVEEGSPERKAATVIDTIGDQDTIPTEE